MGKPDMDLGPATYGSLLPRRSPERSHLASALADGNDGWQSGGSTVGKARDPGNRTLPRCVTPPPHTVPAPPSTDHPPAIIQADQRGLARERKAPAPGPNDPGTVA